LYCLANGFIITSVLWASALAALIDGAFRRAAIYLALAGVLALFGIIHSPLPRAVIDLPRHLVAELENLPTAESGAAALTQTPYHWAGAYLLCALLLVGLAKFGRGKPKANAGAEVTQP